MEDLLQSQIQDSCRLALPNGLKELMNDISREVLRAQPPDVFKFITDYLSALLVTRENLHIAARVCNAVCDCDCRPELEDELRYMGLDEQVASEAAEIIEKFFVTGKVNEGNLLIKLVNKTSIDENEVTAVLSAIRKAYLRHQRNHTQIYETSSNSDEDESEKAVRHTLGIYRKTAPGIETFNCMAQKIQASYRAYKVRREKETVKSIETDQLLQTPSRTGSIKSTDDVTQGIDHVVPSRTENLEKTKVTFGGFKQSGDQALDNCKDGDFKQKFEPALSRPMSSVTIPRLSSTSLAGSYLSLPQYKPYSAHDFANLAGLEETPEKERSTYDYTRENSPIGEHINDMTIGNGEEQDAVEEEDSVEEESIEEVIGEEYTPGSDDVQFIEGILEQIIVGNDEDNIAGIYETEDLVEENIEERGLFDENTRKIDIMDEGLEENVEENIVEVEEDIEDAIIDDADGDSSFGDVTGSY